MGTFCDNISIVIYRRNNLPLIAAKQEKFHDKDYNFIEIVVIR